MMTVKATAPLLAILLLTAAPLLSAAELKPKPGPFFEPDFPFYQTQVDLTVPGGPLAENFAVRGLVLPLAHGMAVAFDQDLLRIAGIWSTSTDKPLVTPMNMAQISYARPHDKAGAQHARPTGPIFFPTALKPGAATSAEALKTDPRQPNATSDLGRGALPDAHGRFLGIEDCGTTAVLHYRVGQTRVREWHEVRPLSGQTVILRHFAIQPEPGQSAPSPSQPLHFAVGPATWLLPTTRLATCSTPEGALLAVATNSDALTLATQDGELTATFTPAPGGKEHRFTLALALALAPGSAPAAAEASSLPGQIGVTPPAPTPGSARRWPEAITTAGTTGSVKANGLALDLLALPEDNPWKRRVRAADIGFLAPDRAAVLTYDGDVWLADGLQSPNLERVTWHRFASGLHESLALAIVDGGVQVATKNGLVRLRDRDHNGEADWYENFSDAMRQSQSTRAFPLDMDIGPDGSTYVSQGGIPMGGGGTSYLGSVARITPDGRSAEIISTGAREPYVTVHPQTGLITGTDQQGAFIPSSVSYLIRPGDHFGFNQEKPAKLTPPLLWIPHTEDNSCASQVWITGNKFGPMAGQLLHLSYGNGGLFLISPDLDAPIPQGAFIPLGLDTKIPILQGRLQPDGAAAWLAGFQIYDSRAPQLQALGRLRLSGDPVASPISAKSCADGVILNFASPLKADSVRAEQVTAQAWNYLRSKAYGSGRYRKDGTVGMDPVGVSQAVVSKDRRSVFIHLPGLGPVMQLEVRHTFKLENGTPAEGVTYFTIHQPHAVNLAQSGFPGVDLTKTDIVSRPQIEGLPTETLGKTLSVTLGCIACHSVDGTKEGKTGPTWKGLFGIEREFADGSQESANEFYLRDSILNPQRKIVKGYLPGMASYKGVLTDAQIESLIMYIRSL
ncbi:DUF6797 domain-containing protein [Verrucomicrobium sp. BvORR034]|uniref:DUF6797 domain-containing protein n=1 Tax=Verrucomicrobium sp. BvORR034 TaxID=1396418 RepID=UPI00067939C1|nr:DUF6797 domain-containing protein [Verrucomicrobium sp. BvORR034]